MKIKNGALEILMQNQAINELFTATDIPIEISFRLAEFAAKLKTPMEVYLKEKRKLAEKFADKTPDQKPAIESKNYIITQNAQQFQKEFETLCNLTIDVEQPIIQLGQWAQGKLNATDIRELSGLIQFTFEGDR